MHWRGFFELTPGKSRVVYMQEIDVNGLSLSDAPLLKEKVHKAMEEGLRRYRNYPSA